MRSTFKYFSLFIMALPVVAAVSVRAQVPAPAAPVKPVHAPTHPSVQVDKAKPQKTARAQTRQARVTMVKDQEKVAPQVVTIVHRLSGVKLLRYLLRNNGEGGTVATIDPEAIKKDAHASIIAGWAMEDGKTIAARLPQAAAEMEVLRFGLFPPAQPGESAEAAQRRRIPRAPQMQPDLTVMTQDGRTFRARYIGI
ncbi:MAG TPA: hypothetical protein VGW76_12465, partial [Pyrinomonadaceae bacterium]|nr:hypothetical protein [Pyrinomonadaceae bacterium]